MTTKLIVGMVNTIEMNGKIEVFFREIQMKIANRNLRIKTTISEINFYWMGSIVKRITESKKKKKKIDDKRN